MIVTILSCPLVEALFLTAATSLLDDQFCGKGMKLVESNLMILFGSIVNRYFHIYQSPEAPADLGSKSVNSGSSREGLPDVFSGFVPFCRQT